MMNNYSESTEACVWSNTVTLLSSVHTIKSTFYWENLKILSQLKRFRYHLFTYLVSSRPLQRLLTVNLEILVL